jgi:putative ABC transport system permease protein
MALPLSYNVRNLRVRWQVTLLAIIGIALVVGVFVVLGAMAAGFRIALRSTGRTDNVIVLQKGADGEMTSGIPRSGTSLMSVDSRVARDAKGQPMASPEILIVANLKRITDNQETNVALRGVTLKALEVRGDIKIVEGRAFQPGLYEMIVGQRTRERYGLEIGKSMRLQRKDWQIVGVFSSGGSAFESEVWGDVDVMGPAFDRQGGYQVLVARLADPSSLDAFKKSVENNPQLQVTAEQELDFYDKQAGTVGQALTTLAWFVSLIMAIGAVTGAMNTMFAIVSSRTREIGTLRALGFSRVAILISFVLESAVLALIGGAIGCLLALPFNGMTGATSANFSDLAFAFRVTTSTLLVGIAFALLMGVFGGLLPAIRAARMPITAALREA